GIINCSDYDFGTQNVAYYDKEYQWLSGGPNNGTWNFGWQYRNDGVDIEACSDLFGAKYNVGWIDAAEWINYTVEIEQTGVYGIDLRIASSNSTGKIKLYMDNNEITSIIEVPNTGGWQTWATTSVSDVELQAGTSSLKLYFLEGGFNINHVDFKLISTSGDSTTNPDGVVVSQNYPNPFSISTKAGNSTTIKFNSASTGEVILVIYNVLGQRVYQEKKILESSGENSFIYDGRDFNGNILNGGIYFYSINYSGAEKSKRQIQKMIVL
ncbi:carbohydrate-binding protein, partial [candidate division KSB1 bacterium]|nr:carbohydrate-binding protein [candidate division KSB1 bacterium]